jgi:GntR family transcriptional regulator/MocR family aminotransferase
MRAIYTARRAALVDALARHAPAIELHGLAAGLHAIARLPGPASEAAVISAARARSVGLYGLSRYRTGEPPARCELVIGFGNVPEEAIDRGIAAVASVLDPGPRSARRAGSAGHR